jgi:hypothetical protein
MTGVSKLPLHLAERNRARDYYNPLRGLDMPRVIRLLEAGERGEHADLQWLYRTVEKRDATLRGLKMRRTSALKKLDWDIKVPDELPPGATPALAEAQAASLRVLYDGIDNLPEVFEFLALASFRGFSHLEKRWRDNNPALPLERLMPVPQWHWVRHPQTWAWIYDPKAQGDWSGGVPVNPDDFIIRELDDPINEIALICFLRKNMSQKDWDSFVEDFGIPSIFAMLGEGTPADKVKEWLEMIEKVTGNSRGALPPGAKVQTIAHGNQGETPFKQHKDEQREELVLAGTGGLLSMLTAPTGLNSDQAGVHEAAFDAIALAESAHISSLLQAGIPGINDAGCDEPDGETCGGLGVLIATGVASLGRAYAEIWRDWSLDQLTLALEQHASARDFAALRQLDSTFLACAAAWGVRGAAAEMNAYREKLRNTIYRADPDAPDPIEENARRQTSAREAAGIKQIIIPSPPLEERAEGLKG